MHLRTQGWAEAHDLSFKYAINLEELNMLKTSQYTNTEKTFSGNSEANTSAFPENLEEMFIFD